MTNYIELLEKHLAAYGAGKWDEYKQDLANDVIYEEVALRQRVQGPDEYIKFVARWKKAFPDLAAKVKNIFGDGDNFVAEILWEGTQSGPLESPFGTIPASGKRGSTNATLVVKMKNGKIAEVHHYFDLLTVLLQAGIMPTLGAPAVSGKTAVPPPRNA